MGSCIDLREYQNDEVVSEIFGKLISGKAGYKAVIDKTKPPKQCPNEDCRTFLKGEEKFCPECGTKIEN